MLLLVASASSIAPGLFLFLFLFVFLFFVFTCFPAGTVQIRWHEQLQQEISNLSILVASQMDITGYHFDRFKVP